MEISEVLAERDVLMDVDVTDKTAILNRLAKQAADALELKAAEVETALQEREKLGSTGTGDGIAIPHARLRKVTRPIGVFARSKRPIDFQAIDGEPVDLFFLLLLPASNEGRYLSVLAAVARKLRNADTQARLRSADTQARLYASLRA
ncbi:PTS sugar transporter subunit IIA [Bradyrhizobium sp. LHD-71]|uniref:PTS sugar transporter subunit IIA n=1 Tax=Bradyrhizobium sp. LHD-71 TaxID=3072141 RepID=UPI00280EB4B7|nr:PTS sugar transporter subunit IIA [Bradyrhizobium sp. LHD-71]MDQ8727726.1 PTS sugar transporter subunit IIA [Bradyrhizobium sp. LHD-71]